MEPLSAYIPQDRRRTLASGAALPDRMVGAALFADISGFTPLTEALAGTTVARMAAAEHLAGKGEVLVDEPTVARLGAALRVAGWRADDETGERFAVISELSVENIELGNMNSLDNLSQITIL